MSLVTHISALIATDDYDQSDRLIRDYKALSPKRREAVDDAFVCLCGYSLATLIAEEEEADAAQVEETKLDAEEYAQENPHV